jgi:hypothetical protein
VNVGGVGLAAASQPRQLSLFYPPSAVNLTDRATCALCNSMCISEPRLVVCWAVVPLTLVTVSVHTGGRSSKWSGGGLGRCRPIPWLSVSGLPSATNQQTEQRALCGNGQCAPVIAGCTV